MDSLSSCGVGCTTVTLAAVLEAKKSRFLQISARRDDIRVALYIHVLESKPLLHPRPCLRLKIEGFTFRRRQYTFVHTHSQTVSIMIHTIQLKTFAGQKFQPTHLPLHYRNISQNKFLPMIAIVISNAGQKSVG